MARMGMAGMGSFLKIVAALGAALADLLLRLFRKRRPKRKRKHI